MIRSCGSYHLYQEPHEVDRAALQGLETTLARRLPSVCLSWASALEATLPIPPIYPLPRL